MPPAGKVLDKALDKLLDKLSCPFRGRDEEDAICKFAAFLASALMVYSEQAGPGVSHGLQTTMIPVEGAIRGDRQAGEDDRRRRGRGS